MDFVLHPDDRGQDSDEVARRWQQVLAHLRDWLPPADHDELCRDSVGLRYEPHRGLLVVGARCPTRLAQLRGRYAEVLHAVAGEVFDPADGLEPIIVLDGEDPDGTDGKWPEPACLPLHDDAWLADIAAAEHQAALLTVA